MKDQTKIIAALLVGAAAGAAIGLLLAPESGSELREDIADYVNDLVDKTKNKAQSTAEDIKEYGTNIADKAKSKWSSVVGAASDYKDQAEEYTDDAYDEAKSKFKGEADNLNSSIQNA
ncbi:YtxH domain-containing protein [Mucilaginibacter terrae]|uniref:Gas vesicle protein n=1 Tax=Mucilaginibacter terrae TaxID=1955052 RepID=A0ABU3GSK3_9SPHI|nr:YtxH domain-containing protein [Mucilaginibacter terrae]MDT3401645.1 gas vesicle protein [Mucilaginibacter terrae]